MSYILADWLILQNYKHWSITEYNKSLHSIPEKLLFTQGVTYRKQFSVFSIRGGGDMYVVMCIATIDSLHGRDLEIGYFPSEKV